MRKNGTLGVDLKTLVLLLRRIVDVILWQLRTLILREGRALCRSHKAL